MEAFYSALCLICLEPEETGEPCLQCKNCHRMQQWMHPDVYLMLPAFEPKPDYAEMLRQWRNFTADRDFFTVSKWAVFLETDKKPNLYKDQVRDMMLRYSLKPYEGGKKLFIIWGMEYLDRESNRILKILEEPTDDTYFILVTYDKKALLPTVLSRTQQFDISVAEDDQMEVYAKTLRLGHSEQIREAIYLADGNIAEMIDILQDDRQAYSELLLDALRSAYSRNGVKMAEWAETAARLSPRNYWYFLKYQLHFIREAMAGYTLEDYKKRLLPSERKAAEWLLSKVRDRDVLSIASEVDKYSYALNQHVNSKILSMKIILEYQRLFYNH